MKLFILTLLITQCLYASELVVKTKSTHLGSGFSYNGSGTLFKSGNDFYVITSNHVNLTSGRDRNNITNEINNNCLKKQETVLLANGWEEGMALLKLVSPQGACLKTVPTLGALFGETSEKSEVQLKGFPARAKELLVDHEARILKVNSDRSLFKKGTRIVEVLGHAEFGMSGGGLFSETDKYLGLISHQSIKLVSGSPSVIDTKGHNTEFLRNDILVIDSSSVRTWIEKVLAGSHKPTFTVKAQDQVNGKEIIYGYGLKFEFQAVKSLKEGDYSLFSSSCIGGVDIVGIGGVDIMGIGGVDIMGIGGELSFSSSCELGKERGSDWIVKVSETHHPSLGNNDPSWVVRLKEKLKTRNELFLTNLVYNLNRVPIRSAYMFLNKVSKDVWPSIASEKIAGQDLVDPEIEQSVNQLVEFIPAGKLTAPTAVHVNQLKLIVETYSSGQGHLISESDLERVINKASAWEELYGENDTFDATVNIEGWIYNIYSKTK